MHYKTATIVWKILVGLILFSTLHCWKLVFLPWSLVVQPWTKLNLLTVGLHFPGFALCLVGSVALFLGKRWGYYCIYADFPFSIIGAYICFIPYAMRFLPLSSATPYLMMWGMLLGINLLVTGILALTHLVVSKERA
jgi:hypothetical protein